MLTIEKLKEMAEGTFATGVATDNPEGINMANTNKDLRWVAVRGGIHDWDIYCHCANRSVEWIERHGDKVNRESHIRKLVECDDEAFNMYRY